MAIFSKPLPAGSRKPLIVIIVALLILRSRLLKLPRAALDTVAARANLSGANGKKLSPEELNKVLQEVYTTEEDGSRTLLVPYRDRVEKIPIHPTPSTILKSNAAHFPPLPPQAKSKPNIDAAFLKQLRAILLRVAMPNLTSSGASLFSKETSIVLGHSFFLVLRTVLSIMVARLDGRIVRDLVRADGKGFLKGLGLWFLLAVPSTYTNSMIRHLQSTLSLSLRTKLTRYIHDLYLAASPDLRYYRSGLEGVDQYITADVEAWAESMAGLYGNLLKPSLDLLLFTSQLSRSLGVRGTLLLFGNYYATVAILRAVTPAFGRLAAVEARLEGEYRAGMGRVGRESEEVAFYDGGVRERDILTRAYMRLIKHVNSIYKIRIAYEWTEDYVIKYLWSAAGYALIAVPILYTRTKRSLGIQTTSEAGKVLEASRKDDAVAGRTEAYISNRRLLLSLADAGGRLMYAYKDLLELAGLTTRLYTLLSTLHNLPPLPSGEPNLDGSIELIHVDVGIPASVNLHYHASVEGAEEEGDMELDETVTPALVKDLSLVIKEREHLMITGPNGVGKTAVARVLAGLWAPQGALAEVRRPVPSSSSSSDDFYSPSNSTPNPARKQLIVVPQRAYMVTGSLLEQVIYPHSYAQFVASGRKVEELHEILELVFLAYLPEREGGWATRKEWRDVLSGGEKQRMGLARVFYHRPRFAVLDECTSAVSSDVEGRMYESLKSWDVTLITISLRPSLAKYHTQLLALSGDGSSRWTLSRVGTAEERMGIDREIITLEKKLADVEKWEKRVKELEGLLSITEKVNEEKIEEKVIVEDAVEVNEEMLVREEEEKSGDGVVIKHEETEDDEEEEDTKPESATYA
ncbi:ABC transporter transmembrane region 2-domain-containing protein [Crucibulum laeve]|uniref:ABC transporter transmembrane region 2-domain-containing protein n=1 Tax=Crucibulum laeve TaxID=68775 RepID=A0A5C3M600_9AGAR|nr:ABC transporter transmembrane region 2-domain-containing protein [Crucibulum laeve]